MAAWLTLTNGGVPHTVKVLKEGTSRRWYGGYKPAEYEEKPVVDAETVAIWWSEYRRQLAEDWAKKHPPQTYKAFLAECAVALGFKGKTFDEKIAKARAWVLSQQDKPAKPAMTAQEAFTRLMSNGTPLPEEDYMLDPCPHCGKRIDCSHNYCPLCGENVNETPLASAAQNFNTVR